MVVDETNVQTTATMTTVLLREHSSFSNRPWATVRAHAMVPATMALAEASEAARTCATPTSSATTVAQATSETAETVLGADRLQAPLDHRAV